MGNLRGTWFDPESALQIEIDIEGHYWADESGKLASDPGEEGTVDVDAATDTVTLTVDSSRSCQPGDALVFEDATTFMPLGLLRMLHANAEDDCHRFSGAVDLVIISS